MDHPQQSVECHVTNVLVGIKQEPTKDVDGQHLIGNRIVELPSNTYFSLLNVYTKWGFNAQSSPTFSIPSQFFIMDLPVLMTL